jgi:hypothetical protein
VFAASVPRGPGQCHPRIAAPALAADRGVRVALRERRRQAVLRLGLADVGGPQVGF